MEAIRRTKKILNFRLPSVLALSLAAGIVFGTALSYLNADEVYVLVPFLITAVPVGVFAVIKKRPSLIACYLIIAVLFIIGSVYVGIIYRVFTVSDVPLNQTCEIKGRVDSVGVTAGGRIYLVISQAYAEGVKLNGKVIAYLGENAGDYCANGYLVTFSAKLSKQDFFSEGQISYRALDGIKYYCSIYGGLHSTYKFSLFGTVNSVIRNALFNNLDGETASVCFAMLTGNSSLISEGTLSSFRNGGIAHLFAVSGLHIGVIFGMITLLLKKLPVNRYVSAVIRIVAIIFYAGVCGFTPSSVRAAVMCSVSALALLTYQKYDAINALSIVAVILLLVNPLYLYGAGFILTFVATLGILLFSKSLKRLFRFIPEKISSPLSVGLSAQMAIIPAQLYCFGSVSWAGLLLNLIIIPVVTVLYLLLFICTILSVIFPFAAGALIPFAATPVQLLVNLVVDLGFENAVISKTVGLWIFLPFVLLLAGISDVFNLRPSARGAICSAAIIGLSICFIL